MYRCALHLFSKCYDMCHIIFRSLSLCMVSHYLHNKTIHNAKSISLSHIHLFLCYYHTWIICIRGRYLWFTYEAHHLSQRHNLYICVIYLQDKETVVAQDTCILKELETKLNDAVTGAKNAIKNESNLVKKCILRRGASLYAAVKRIKNNKKPRQTLARRALKTHCSNNVENSAIICAVKSQVEAKSFLKTIDRYRSGKSSVIGDNLEPHLSKRLTNNSARMSSEETAAIRHGAKRLKIISSTRTLKALPEIRESSSVVEETSAKMSSKMTRAYEKQNAKGTHDRARPGGPVKPDKSFRLKETNKTAVKESSVFEEKHEAKS